MHIALGRWLGKKKMVCWVDCSPPEELCILLIAIWNHFGMTLPVSLMPKWHSSKKEWGTHCGWESAQLQESGGWNLSEIKEKLSNHPYVLHVTDFSWKARTVFLQWNWILIIWREGIGHGCQIRDVTLPSHDFLCDFFPFAVGTACVWHIRHAGCQFDTTRMEGCLKGKHGSALDIICNAYAVISNKSYCTFAV